MARKLVVQIVGDTRQLERSFGRASRSVSSLAGSFLGAYGLAAGIRAAAQESANAAQVSAQTAAAIKSTGGAANVTAKQIDQLANSMLRKTGIDDEATKSAENQLLAFRNIRNEVGRGNDIFNRAAQATADLATRMNRGAVPSAEQMQAAAIKLGKALNDPVKGLTALRRVGVQFSDEQTTQIKKLVEAGRTMDAQKLILQELTRQFGGAADAAGRTMPGQIAILQESLRNLGGDLATQFTPAITDATGALLDMLEAFKKFHHQARGGGGGGGITGALKRIFTSTLPAQVSYFWKQNRIAWDFITGKDSSKHGGTAAQRAAAAAGFGDVLLTRGQAFTPPFAPRINPRLGGVFAAVRGAAGRIGTNRAIQRNTWFDQMIGRQLGRVGDVGLSGQMKRLRTIAQEIQRNLAGTHDPTRRLNLADQLLDISRRERDVQGQITDNIKQGNQALRDRADAIKSAVLGQMQRGQQQLENRQQLQDALRQLDLARRIGGPMGIQAAARDVQKARFAVAYTGLEAAPAKLRGGQFAYGGVTINVHGVTDPEQVARKVVAVLERRKRHTSTQSRGSAVDTSPPR